MHKDRVCAVNRGCRQHSLAMPGYAVGFGAARCGTPDAEQQGMLRTPRWQGSAQ